MAVTVLKKQRQPVELHSAPPSPMQVLIDEIGQMEPEVTVAKKLVSQFEAKLKSLRGMLGELELDPNQTYVEKGQRYQMTAGPCAAARVVTDIQAARKFLGDELFMQLATLKLSDLDKYLVPHQLAQVVSSQPGTRPVKVIEVPT